MTFMHMDALSAASVMVGTVSVSGEAIGSIGVGSQLVRLDFLAVGTVFAFSTQLGNNQIDSATDWIIPNGEASSDYEVRYTTHTGDAFTIFATTENNWINIGANRSYGFIDSDPGGFFFKFASAVFEIRKNGGPVLDSATYTFFANRTS